ncbi:23S rRNA pseudouridine synthase [Sterolibacterium denitrificans]|uniref:Pseudouridine synthase n=1 Tax=Sterolibacterium denitrificans TaxID=157592 RepID=A0A7Z7HU69_9PROT|nr:23S rRNA pseudouridine synthase [Sterolibacterium denitrificans]
MNPTDYSASVPASSVSLHELVDGLEEDGGGIVGTRVQVSPEHAGLRLDQALARLLPQHSRSRLQGWLREGHVRIDGRVVTDAKHKVWGGECIELEDGLGADPRGLPAVAESIPLRIVHEDEEILVVDKPAGLVVHPGSGNWQGTLLNALLHHAPALAAIPRAGIVHRLDKETSGLLVVAKTLEAQTDLVRQLQARSVRRHYLALVHGVVAAERTGGTVDAPIGRHPTQRTRMAVVPLERHGKEARTHYLVRERFAAATLLECRLETGRTHQIRVHMMELGHPLVGDPVYLRGKRSGQPLFSAFPRQALHAWRLALRHPRTQLEMSWEAPLPEDFAALLGALRAQNDDREA